MQTASPDEFVSRAHSAHSIGRSTDAAVAPNSRLGVTSSDYNVATGNCSLGAVRRQFRKNAVRYIAEGSTEISPRKTAVAAA